MGKINSLSYNSYGKLIIDGKTIFDFSNVTVGPNNLQEGYTGVDRFGKIITGSMPTISNYQYIPTTTPQTIQSNSFIGQNVTVAGEPNLKAEYIHQNHTIFGIKGTLADSAIKDWDTPGFYATITKTNNIVSHLASNVNVIGVEFRNVTAVAGTSTFSECSNLKYVFNIPETLTSANLMFKRCTKLNCFYPTKLPTSLADCTQMFNGCTALTNANFLQEGLVTGTSMFFGCTKLTEVDYMPGTLTTATTMFSGCSTLTKFNVINCTGAVFDVASNEIKGVFTNVNTFTGSNIALLFESATKLSYFGGFSGNALNATNAYRAFYGCTAINSTVGNINLPSKITNAYQAYYGATKITDITIPDSVTDATQMFQGCTSFTNAAGGKNITTSTNMFYGLKTPLDIRCDFEKLSTTTRMFSECSNIQYIEKLPATITAVTNMFYNSVVHYINRVCCTGPIFNTALLTKTTLRKVGTFENTDISQAFRQQSLLTQFNGFTGNSLNATNAQYTFIQCTNLQSNVGNINLPNTVVDGSYCYQETTKITDVSLPDNLTTATQMFRAATGLVNVYNAGSKLATANLMFYGCTALKNIFSDMSAVVSGDRMFHGCTGNISIKTPFEKLNNCSQMFRNCGNIAYIEKLPRTIVTINNMFAGAIVHKINRIDVPGPTFYTMMAQGGASCLQKVGSFEHENLAQAFYGRTSLTQFINGFTNNAQTATNAHQTFQGVTALNSRLYNMNLPDSVTIASNSYYGATQVFDIKLPNNLTTATNMFRGCTNLNSVTGNASKLTDSRYMFMGCTNLQHIETLPASLTSTYQMFNGNSKPLTVDNMFIGGTTFNVVNSTWRSIITNVNVYQNSSGICSSNGMFESSVVQRVNYVNQLSVGYRMFLGAYKFSYANFVGSSNTLTNVQQMFYGCNNITNIVGFSDDVKVDFNSLTDCVQTFRTYKATANYPNIRISSKAASAINFTNFLNSATGVKKVIINVPNATTLTLTSAFRSTTSITDIYLNTKVTPTMTDWLYGKSASVRLNIFVPNGSLVNNAIYQSGTSTTAYMPAAYKWTLNADGSYYNTTANIYVYPTLTEGSEI